MRNIRLRFVSTGPWRFVSTGPWLTLPFLPDSAALIKNIDIGNSKVITLNEIDLKYYTIIITIHKIDTVSIMVNFFVLDYFVIKKNAFIFCYKSYKIIIIHFHLECIKSAVTWRDVFDS